MQITKSIPKHQLTKKLREQWRRKVYHFLGGLACLVLV